MIYTLICTNGHKTATFISTDEAESDGFEVVCPACDARVKLEPSHLELNELEREGFLVF